MKKIKKIFLILLTFVLISQPILSALFIPTSAANEVGSFDSTSIEDDLGADVIKQYPQNDFLEPEIIYVLEYAYSVHSEYQQFYNIYLYVYNPSGKPISMLNEGFNLVSMVTGPGENGDDKDINTVALDYVDRTSDNLIYKFKLSNPKQLYEYQKEYAEVHEEVRRYEFTKLQLKYAGGVTETKEFAKTYEFSGYSAYCDKNKSPESTLKCLDFVNSTIELQLQHTNYRAEAQEDGIQDEINSVYFSIPNRYYCDNETLHGVNAEWYEYRTKPIYVTSDSGSYSNLWSMLTYSITPAGKIIDVESGGAIDVLGVTPTYSVYWDIAKSEENYYFGSAYGPRIGNYIDDDGFFDKSLFGDYSGNIALGTFEGVWITDKYVCEDRIDWLIKVDDTWSDNAYKVSSEKVKEFMQLYTNRFASQNKICGKYAAGLFETSIDVDRIQFLDDVSNGATSGKMSKKFTSDESFTFTDSNKTQTKWNEFWFGTQYIDVPYSPIVEISYGDLHLSVDDFVAKYFVNAEDVQDIQSYAKRSYENNETPVLLRFAVTDYYSSEACFDYALDNEFSCYKAFSGLNGNGYIAQQTMFLDFNVIELEFKSDEGVVRSVGAVAEPIDIINGLTPPDSLVEDEEWYQKLVGLILVVIVLFAIYVALDIFVPWLAQIIRWFVGAFWWLFISLVKFITWPFRAFFDNIGYQVKRTLKIRSPRRSRGRSGKSRSSRNSRFWQKTVDDLKSSIDQGKASLRNSIKNMFNNKKE